MTFSIQNRSFFFIPFFVFFFSCITAAPISESDNPLIKFVEFLVTNNCSIPKGVEIPFSKSDDQSNFEFLFKPLKECQTSDALADADGAKFLCNEVFEVLQNITCSLQNVTLPEITSKPLSQYTCKDFITLKKDFPEGNEYLSSKLVDDIVCKLLCNKEKYKPLCQTLLWTHDVQAKIKTVLESSTKDEEIENSKVPIAAVLESSTKDDEIENSKVPITGDENVKVKSMPKKQNLDQQENKDVKASIDSSPVGDKNSQTIPNSLKPPHKNKISIDQTNLDTNEKSTNSVQNRTDEITTSLENSKVSNTSENVSEILDKKISSSHSSQPVLSNQNSQIDFSQNEINSSEKPKTVKENISTSPNTAENSISKISNVKDSEKSATLFKSTPGKEKPANLTSEINTETNGNSVLPVPQENELSDDLSNVITETGRKEIKENSEADVEYKSEKPKLTDFDGPLGKSPDMDFKQQESTTLQIPFERDEDIDQQEEKDSDQYNDTGNEGDYPKAEYDNSFNSLKSKVPTIKNSDVEVSNQMTNNNYDPLLNAKNIGRVPDDIQMISSFPEQEDSHFFFYFLSIVLILMAGYLIFHNKQKIIALIVEGRHERRRRSHGAGYKKLETK